MTLVQQTLNRGLLAHLNTTEWEPINTMLDLTDIVKLKPKFSGPQLMCLAANLVTIGQRIKASKLDITANNIPLQYQDLVDCIYKVQGSFATSFGDKQTYIHVLCGIYLELYDSQFNTIDNMNSHFIKTLMMTERISKSSGIVESIRKKINSKPQGYNIASLIVNPIHRGEDAFVPTLLTTDCYYMDSTMLLRSLPEDKIPQLIIRLKNHLASPLYWEKIKPLYIEVFKNKTRDYATIQALIKDGLGDLIKIPFTPAEFQKITPVAWKIWCMPPVVRAYCLGFPIHLGTFNDQSCKVAIMRYVTMGFREYAKHMGQLGNQSVRPPLEDYGLVEYQSVSDDDLNSEAYESYSPFDRIAYVEDSRVYEFTRRGFEHLAKTKINPYNKNKLVIPFLMTLGRRDEMVLAYNLPPCKPLQSLYVDLGEKLTAEELEELNPPIKALPPKTVDESTSIRRPVIIDYGGYGQSRLSQLYDAGLIHEVPSAESSQFPPPMRRANETVSADSILDESIRGIPQSSRETSRVDSSRRVDSALGFLSQLLDTETAVMRPVLDTGNTATVSRDHVVIDEVAMIGDALMGRYLARSAGRQVTVEDYSPDSDDEEAPPNHRDMD